MPPKQIPVRVPRLALEGSLPEEVDWFELYRRAVVRAGQGDPVTEILYITIRVLGMFTVVTTVILSELYVTARPLGIGVSARNPLDQERPHVGVGIALRRSLDDLLGIASHPYQRGTQ